MKMPQPHDDDVRLIKQRGFSLVELMIATTLGLIITSAAIEIFMAQKQTVRVTQNLSRLQENARYALDFMSREIRMAGYMGCRAATSVVNVLDTSSTNYDDWSMNFTSNALRGYNETDTASLPTTFAAEVLAGTDSLILIHQDSTPFTIDSHNPCAAQFQLAGSHDLLDDEIVMVTDCSYAGIFQITNANQANVTIVHNTGSVGSIGNTSKCIGGDCSGACTGYHAYGPDATLARLLSSAFYIASTPTGEPALYWRSMQGNPTSAAEILVEGVENMQILYGVDNGSDNVPDQFYTANAVPSWNNIIAVRIGLLLRSDLQVRSDTDNNIYSLPGLTIGPATPVSHPMDSRKRQVITSTVQIRNRG